MKKRKRVSLSSFIPALIVGLSFCFYACTWDTVVPVDPDPTVPPVPETCEFVYIDKLEMPEMDETDTNGQFVEHIGFSLWYNKVHEQPDWVAYLLTRERTKAVVGRADCFRPDPAVSTGTATNDDYAKTGYDRGHLAPCADMRWSDTTMKESFFFSNMTPQAPSFNRGIWAKLEDLVRIWAIEYDSIYIATGPVLKGGDFPTIGKKKKVSVPEYNYKAILHYTSTGIKGIGFILPNEGSNQPLQDFAVTIDSVQNFTGINFFYQLSDPCKKEIFETICDTCWIWSKKDMTVKE